MEIDSNEKGILISEIKTDGEKNGDEFIELYNPNGYAVDLEGWSIKKKTKAGVTEYSLLSDMGKRVDPVTGLRDDSGVALQIPSRGYFLIAPRYVCGANEDEKCYAEETAADNYYSTKGLFLADDNSIALYDGEKILADKVGWGAAGDFSGNIFAENIPAGKSLERRIVAGEMQNTGDNSRDFFMQELPDAQNSKSSPVVNDSGENETDAASEDTEESVGENEIDVETANEDSAEEGAQDPVSEKKIFISEILISPAGDDTKLEFVEIFNAGNGVAGLGGWSLEDQSGKAGKYIFPSGSKIGPGEYQAYYSAQTKLSLNNDGDGAILKDAEGSVISKTPQSGAAEESFSFALENGSWSWTSVPTPSSKNIIKEKEAEEKKAQEQSQSQQEVDVIKSETTSQQVSSDGVEDGSGKEDISSGEKYDFSDGVSINEIFPDPLGKDNQANNFEWVELFNENDRSVNLKGWCLDDVLEKGSKAYCFSSDKIIAAKKYLVVSSSETKIAFNNSEEEVNLLWPDGKVVDSVSYQKAKEGYSYSLGALGGWDWTQDTTPSSANAKTESSNKIATASSSKKSLASSAAGKETVQGKVLSANISTGEKYDAMIIAEAKKLPLGSPVQLSGLVSAPRGTLGKDISYILEKDSGEGIQIFGDDENLSALRLGDEVKVAGKITEVGGEKRLAAAAGSAEKISGDNLLESFALDFSDLESSLGSLVAVEGEVGSIADDRTLLLKVTGGELKIYAEPETGISFQDIRSGNRVLIAGIFSRTSLGYRLLPRFKSDIRFLESKDSAIISDSRDTAAKNDGFVLCVKFAFLCAVLIVISRWKPAREGNKKIRLPREEQGENGAENKVANN